MSTFYSEERGIYTRVVSNLMYSRQSIAAAQSAFRAHCSVTVRPQGQGNVAVHVKPLGESAREPTQAVLEFWNFVLDTEAQRRLAMS